MTTLNSTPWTGALRGRKQDVRRLQAIIFDVDGTLADTEDVHRLAFNHVFQEYGLDWNWTPELYRELLAISGGRERIADYGRRLRSRFPSSEAFTDFVVSMHRAKTRKYAAMLTEGQVRLRPGIRRLLDERPDAVGLAVPGMPVGSPGMDGPAYGGRRDPYQVLLVAKDGSTSVFSSYR